MTSPLEREEDRLRELQAQFGDNRGALSSDDAKLLRKAERRVENERRRQEERDHPERSEYLKPLDRPFSNCSYLVFDIESKKQDTDKKGFERPFLACLFDGETYTSYRSDEHVRAKSYVEEAWHDPGGCIDKMLRFIFGIRECAVCEISAHDYEWGRCAECVAARRRFQKKGWKIVAHNGGNFDNLFVLGWVRRHPELFASSDIVNVASRMLLFTIRPHKKAQDRDKDEGWSFADSVALIPLSLKEIGKTFGKGNPDAEKMVFDLDITESDPSWEEYNRRDCSVLHSALLRFRELIEKIGGAVGLTAASTALQTFRRAFQEKPIERCIHFKACDGFCHDPYCVFPGCRFAADGNIKEGEERACHGCLHTFVRNAFFGGRTEIYRMKGKRLFYYDLNSSYPAAMLEDMPVGGAKELPAGTSIGMLMYTARTKIGFVECVVDVPRWNEKTKKGCYLPPLPYRMVKKSGEMKLVFPTGRLYGVWSWIELEMAVAAGCKILSVGKSIWYRKAKIFVEMIHTLYSYRQKKCKNDGCGKNVEKGECLCEVKTWDAGMDYVAKLLMNSCFGKFATNVIREKTLFIDDIEEIPEDASLPLAWIPHSTLTVPHILKADYIVPQIPSWITALARRRLYQGALSVLERGGEIMYADTDSILCTMAVTPEGTKLGEWKLEDENFDYDAILPKMYMLAKHRASCKDKHCEACWLGHKKTCADKDNCPGCDLSSLASVSEEMLDNKCEKQLKSRTTECSLTACVSSTAQAQDTWCFKPRRGIDDRNIAILAVKCGSRGRACVISSVAFKVRAKGVPRGAQNRETYGTLKSKGEVHFMRTTKFKTMLRKGFGGPRNDEAFRAVKTEYDKRTIVKEGKDAGINTVPLVFWDPPTVKEARAAKGLIDYVHDRPRTKKSAEATVAAE